MELGGEAGFTRDGAEVQDLVAVIRMLAADDGQVLESEWRELLQGMEDNAAEVPAPPAPSPTAAATTVEGGGNPSQR